MEGIILRDSSGVCGTLSHKICQILGQNVIGMVTIGSE